MCKNKDDTIGNVGNNNPKQWWKQLNVDMMMIVMLQLIKSDNRDSNHDTKYWIFLPSNKGNTKHISQYKLKYFSLDPISSQ